MFKAASHVRTQLRMAFAFVIALSFFSTAIAIWRLHVLVQGIEALIQPAGRLHSATIDTTAKAMLASAADSTGMLVLLCLLTLAGSLGASALFARSLFRRLGGEPSEAARIANEIAAGNLDVRVVLRPGDQGSLLHALQCMRDSLAGIVGKVREGTATIGASIQSMASEAQDLSRRTESQAAALERTATSMNELARAVGNSAANAVEANGLALAGRTHTARPAATAGRRATSTSASANKPSAEEAWEEF